MDILNKNKLNTILIDNTYFKAWDFTDDIATKLCSTNALKNMYDDLFLERYKRSGIGIKLQFKSKEDFVKAITEKENKSDYNVFPVKISFFTKTFKDVEPFKIWYSTTEFKLLNAEEWKVTRIGHNTHYNGVYMYINVPIKYYYAFNDGGFCEEDTPKDSTELTQEIIKKLFEFVLKYKKGEIQ